MEAKNIIKFFDDLKWRAQTTIVLSKGFAKRHGKRDFHIKSRTAIRLSLLQPSISYTMQVGALSEVEAIKAVRTFSGAPQTTS